MMDKMIFSKSFGAFQIEELSDVHIKRLFSKWCLCVPVYMFEIVDRMK